MSLSLSLYLPLYLHLSFSLSFCFLIILSKCLKVALWECFMSINKRDREKTELLGPRDKGRSLCPIPQFSQIQTARLLQNSDIGATGGGDATKSPQMLFCTKKELSKVFGKPSRCNIFFSQYNCRYRKLYVDLQFVSGFLGKFWFRYFLFWFLHILMFRGLGFNPFRSGGCLGIGLTPWNGKSNWMNTNSCLKSICVLSPISLTEDISYSRAPKSMGGILVILVCNNMYC